MSDLTPSAKRRALIVVSSATLLPLAQPAGHPGVSTGFFTVELAQVLKEFGEDYSLTFVTPDGRAPQIDINGESLPFRAMGKSGAASVSSSVELGLGRSVTGYRARRADLAARRESELALIRRHLGKLPVSDVLPNTDRDAAAYRAELVGSMSELPERTFLSAQQAVSRHRDPLDAFTFTDFDFVHMPGGHAPMVDFVDSPWLGELVNSLYESGVLISLICHAPVIMASAKYRVNAAGEVRVDESHPFAGARLTTVPRHGEQLALVVTYAKVPRERTRLTYFVDDKLKAAGFQVETGVDPTGVKVVWDETVQLLTGNGPQSVDAQTEQLRERLSERALRRAATKSTI
jgi:putative intracellular protease/amidase